MGDAGERRPRHRRRGDRVDRHRAGRLHRQDGDHRVGPAAPVRAEAHRPGGAREGDLRGRPARAGQPVPVERAPPAAGPARRRQAGGPGDHPRRRVGPAIVPAPFRPAAPRPGPRLTRRWKDHPVPYATPGADITPIIDAPPTPITYLAPGGRFLVLLHHEAHPPIAMLARPYLALGGLRLDAALGARRRMRRLTGLSVLLPTDGTETRLDLPAGSQVGPPIWAPDGRRFAFCLDRADGVGVWTADAATGACAPVPGLTVRDVLGGDTSATGGTVRWSRDGRSLLVLAAPDGQLTLPEPPIEPQTDETSGKHSQMATFTDLLTTPADEDAFEALATTVSCRVDPVTGERRQLGPPGLYQSLNDSPDGTHLLVHRLQRPFSFRVPWQLFARRAEVWDAAGTPAAVLADLPVSDEVPRQGVPTGPRLVSWEERAPASLVWAEALDGGDPVTPADHRDRVLR